MHFLTWRVNKCSSLPLFCRCWWKNKAKEAQYKPTVELSKDWPSKRSWTLTPDIEYTVKCMSFCSFNIQNLDYTRGPITWHAQWRLLIPHNERNWKHIFQFASICWVSMSVYSPQTQLPLNMCLDRRVLLKLFRKIIWQSYLMPSILFVITEQWLRART